MSDLEDFLESTLPSQLEAEEAIHNGDPEPRLAMWSAHEPVTLFGARVAVLRLRRVPLRAGRRRRQW